MVEGEDSLRWRLAGEPRRILVTGATGFVGSHLARTLAVAGHDVTATGRNRYATSRLFRENLRFVAADIRDRKAVAQLCRGQDIVYHVAALTSDWAPRRLFDEVNAGGTQNVVDGCLEAGVTRFVHVSSSAVFFEYRDKLDLPDDAPFATRPSCHYAATKIEAERIVGRAVERGLSAVIVRARAVFGPGDNSLLPRLIEAARRGRLEQIGDGSNVLDLTYIDNLTHALVLAADRGEPGLACTVTNGEPVPLWQILPAILSAFDCSMRPGRVSYPLAYLAATVSEAASAGLPGLGEPTLTRYRVGLIAKSQTFCQQTARRELGYEPIVPVREGIERTVAAMTARDDTHSPMHVRLELYTTGFLEFSEHLLYRGGRHCRVRIPVFFGLLEHPRHGIILFDTGHAPRFLEASRRFPYCLYRWSTPVATCQELSAVAILERQGIAASQVRRIVVSHFHADHIGGLADFPAAELIVKEQAWEAVRRKRGLAAVRHAFLPGLLPEDCGDRIRPIHRFHDAGMGPLEHSHDLFGDGSVRLFEFGGHATGQIGALVQTGPETRKLLVADAVYHSESVRTGAGFHPITRVFVDSSRDARRTLDRLHEFHRQYPDIEIVSTHCPEAAERYRCEEQYARAGLSVDRSPT